MKIDLRQGDCLELMKEIPDASVDLILCDLPYGTTRCKWDSVIPFDLLWMHYRRLAKPNAAIVLTAAQPFSSALVMSNPSMFRHEWIWDKRIVTGALNANRCPLRAHETVLVFSHKAATYHPQMLDRTEDELKRFAKADRIRPEAAGVYGAVSAKNWPTRENRKQRYPTTMLRIGGMNPHHPERKGHPAQKPVALMEYLIKTYSSEGDTVLDNCMGSGTTGVACANTGRHFIGFEKDPGYFITASERIMAANPAANDAAA